MGLPNYQSDFISEQEYLDSEKLSEFKSEYIDGKVYAMAGASANHQRLIFNLCGELYQHLKGSPCEAFSSDMKVRADKGAKYFYPDVIVACKKDGDGNTHFVESPRIIVEVLSSSTQKYDKTFKRLAYQAIPSVEEYVLIEQDFVEIEVCRRAENWLSSFYFLGDNVTLESVGLTLSVADIYQRVENEEMRAFTVENG